MLFAFDFETHLIGDEQQCQCGQLHDQFPPPVCMSWADDDGQSDVITPAEGIALLSRMLARPDVAIIGAETAFDVLVSVAHAKLAGLSSDDLMAAWIEAYEAGRVKDVLIRKRLLDLAVGRFKFHTFSDGRTIKVSHALADAAYDMCRLQLAKGDDTWRLRYAELDGKPITSWPKEARDYALLDAEVTGMVYDEQSRWAEHPLYAAIPSLWHGTRILPDGAEPDPLMDETAQTCHALWLKAVSGVGVCIDERALAQFEDRNKIEFTDLCASNRKHGLLERIYWRDLTRMRAEKSEFAQNKRWAELKAFLDIDDPEALTCWEELSASGLVRWRHKRNTKVARKKMHDLHVRHGSPVPRTESYDPEKHGPFDCVALDADACRIAGEIEKELDIPLNERAMQDYADFVHVAHVLNTDIPKFRKGIDRPIHSRFTPMVETGRTSSSNPPIQNIARGDKEQAGQRECFIPTRNGYVYVDVDFAQLELFCLAQVCKWLLGWSAMGEAILRGEDLHTAFAAKIISARDGTPVTYEELLTRDPKSYANERMAAKGCNFGRPGGLGKATMVAYAAKAYGVFLPVERWGELLQLWDEQWPEMPEYFRWINGRETFEGSGKFCLPQMWSGRLRAGATYTAACNSSYQGLGADLAKLAGWYLFKAQYLRGFDPVLFGAGYHSISAARTGHFIHDQFLVQVPENRAAECLPRVEHWCRVAAREVLPDYGDMLAKKTKGLISRRWSKAAERIETGGVVGVWEDARLFETELDESA